MQEVFKKFFRMEIDFETLKREAELNLDGSDNYDDIRKKLNNEDESITVYKPDVDDFIVACTSAQFADDPDEKLMMWFSKLYSVLFDFYGFDKLVEKYEDYIPNIPTDDEEASWHCFQLIKYKYFFNDEMNVNEIIAAIIQAGETYKINKGRDESEYEYTDEQIRGGIQIFGIRENMESMDEDQKTKYKKMLEEGVSRELVEAMEAKAYALYGGNPLYECDWNLSRDLFERLYEITGDAQYANTLGYIYYYGRCNGGIPEYDKAFKYFTCGHMGGYYESAYKLSDMFLSGKGVPVNKKVAIDLVARIYNENLERFEHHEFGCKYADIALRLGSFFENGDVVNKELLTAYNYYLKARFAMGKRIDLNLYGDGKVLNNIEKSLDRTRDAILKEESEDMKFADEVDYAFLPCANHVLERNRLIKVSMKILSDEEVMITVEGTNMTDEGGVDAASDLLFSDPIIEEVQLSSKYTFFAMGRFTEIVTKMDDDITIENGEFSVLVDEINPIFKNDDNNDFSDPIADRTVENIDNFAKMRIGMKKDEPSNPIAYQFMYLNNLEFELDCVNYKLKKGKLVIEEEAPE